MNQDKQKLSFPKTREAIAIAVAERYSADENFRNSFDRDPKTTIMKHFDIAQEHWPSGVELRILRNDDRHVHIAIPTWTMDDNAQVSDPNLDKISGGTRVEDAHAVGIMTFGHRLTAEDLNLFHQRYTLT